MSRVDLKCDQCGGSFWLYRSNYELKLKKGQEHFFCCNACYAQYRIEHPTPVEFTCDWCRTRFTEYPSRRTRQTHYCSKSCRMFAENAKLPS